MVLEKQLESVASIIFGILLVFKEIVLVVIDAGIDIGDRLFFIKCFQW